MVRWLARRLLLSLVTLWLLASIVFIIANVLPNDVGRSIAGPFAPQETVDQINERLGTNDPLPVQYLRLLKKTVTFDFGASFQQSNPLPSLLGQACFRSAKLAILALIMTTPLAVAAGIFAARRKDKLA